MSRKQRKNSQTIESKSDVMHMYYLKIKGVLGLDKPCVLEIEQTEEEKEEHRCMLKFT